MRRHLLTIILFVVAIGSIALLALERPLARFIHESSSSLGRIEHSVRWRLGIALRGMPDLSALQPRLSRAGVPLGAPIMLRVFKAESQLEVWMQKGQRFAHVTTYPICRWSGDLGPKLREGDRQSPEGFYAVAAHQLNPDSRWHRSFNVGFPNAFDRSLARTGRADPRVRSV